MTAKDNRVKIQSRHDVKGVEVSLADDYADLTLEEARVLARDLLEAIAEAEQTEPPAPAPLDFSDDWPKDDTAKEFAHTSRRHGDLNGCIYVGGYEIGYERATLLYRWLERCLKYHAGADA